MANSNHGSVRGSNLPRESRLFEGRFGRMFRSLTPLELDPEDPAVKVLVHDLARPATDADPAAGVLARSESVGKDAKGPTAETESDAEENLNIPAGYTYFGQFIDHDLTFDPASSMQRKNDPEALVNFRTPRFDLDSVYGRGPADQPYMYDYGKITGKNAGELRNFMLGDLLKTTDAAGKPVENGDSDAVDHLRAPKTNRKGKSRALTGDKRNDENTIVAQLHTVFLRFHNRYADDHPDLSFEEVQQDVRWHYQWVVLHDYLRRIVGIEMVHSILPHLAKPNGNIFEDAPKLRHYRYENDPYLPTEFSTAAFRFGHSMVRPIYRLNRNFKDLKAPDILDGGIKQNGRRMIFSPVLHEGLSSFDAIPKGWTIEWDLYFGDCNDGRKGTYERVQPSYKVDTSLVNPLATLPEFADSPPDEMNLAYRNILRGFAMRLPCGEDVARAMGEIPLEAKYLKIAKAEQPDDVLKSNRTIASFELKPDPKDSSKNSKPFAGKTPLWLYILCEGARNVVLDATEPVRVNGATLPRPALGPVGGRIVAETMIGIMLGDKQCFLTQDPLWKPCADMAVGQFDTLAFINYAISGKPQKQVMHSHRT